MVGCENCRSFVHQVCATLYSVLWSSTQPWLKLFVLVGTQIECKIPRYTQFNTYICSSYYVHLTLWSTPYMGVVGGLNITYLVSEVAKPLREVIKKKNCDESVRLTDSRGGGHPPRRLTDSICEKFRTFFLLNMIP